MRKTILFALIAACCITGTTVAPVQAVQVNSNCALKNIKVYTLKEGELKQVDSSKFDFSRIKTLMKNCPQMSAPQTSTPPATSVPATTTPETKAPETKAPETKAPETKAPETKAPETKAPETSAPATKAPATKAPATSAPQTSAPQTSAPATRAPQTSAPQTTVPGTGTEAKSYAEQVVSLVNAERAMAGLNAVTLDNQIASAALVRAKEIEKSFSHTRPDGRAFNTALTEKGISYRGAGENIAWGQATPEEVMNGWMNSEGHRANILNAKFTKIGVGFYQNSAGRNHWTQLFTY